jgi:hypothetical protein
VVVTALALLKKVLIPCLFSFTENYFYTEEKNSSGVFSPEA